MKRSLLILCVSLATAPAVYAAEPFCGDVVGSEAALERGLFEKKVADQNTRIQNHKASAEPLLQSLDKDPQFPHINPELVKTIESAVEAYGHTAFDVLTPEKREAREKIANALKTSEEFRSLSGNQIEEITQALTRGGMFRIPMFSTKHALYHLWVQLGLQNSKELSNVLIQLQTFGSYISDSQSRKYEAEKFVAQGLKDIKSEQQLIDRLNLAQQEYATKNSFPQDLIDSLVTIAKKYQSSNVGFFDVLTEGHSEAMKQYADLTKTHPFFKSVPQKNIDRAQWVWNQAVTPNLAQQVLEMIKPNENTEKLKAEIALLQEALRFLGYK